MRFVDLYWTDILRDAVRQTAEAPAKWAGGLLARLHRQEEAPAWATSMLFSVAQLADLTDRMRRSIAEGTFAELRAEVWETWG